MLLKMMPTLNDIDVVVRQVKDTSWAVRIPGTDVADGQGGADTSLNSGKGNGRRCRLGPHLKRAPVHHLEMPGRRVDRPPLHQRRGG
jgi:hypothetical protein